MLHGLNLPKKDLQIRIYRLPFVYPCSWLYIIPGFGHCEISATTCNTVSFADNNNKLERDLNKCWNDLFKAASERNEKFLILRTLRTCSFGCSNYGCSCRGCFFDCFCCGCSCGCFFGCFCCGCSCCCSCYCSCTCCGCVLVVVFFQSFLWLFLLWLFLWSFLWLFLLWLF